MKEYKVYGLLKKDKIVYVGCTGRKNVNDRIKAHKYLDKNFDSYRVLCRCLTKENAKVLEEFYICKYDTFNNGLNKTKDGLVDFKKGYEAGIKITSKRVRVYNGEGFDEIYKSTGEAGRQLNLSQSNLSKVARGKRSRISGYKVEYID